MWTQFPPRKGAEPLPQFLAHVYCGQMAGWIKMALGTELGLGPGHIVLDGDPAPFSKRGQSPQFWPILLWPNGGCIKMPLGMELRYVSAQATVLDRDPPILLRGRVPNLRPRLLWPNGCMDQDATWYGGRPRPTRAYARLC